MKTLKITKQKEITAIIDELAGKKQIRIIDYNDLQEAVAAAEKKLKDMGLPKKYWKGCNVYLQPEKLPNSYKYRADAMGARIRRMASGWFVVSIYWTACRKEPYGGPASTLLTLSELAHANTPKSFEI